MPLFRRSTVAALLFHRGVPQDVAEDAEDEVLGGAADVVWRGWSPFSPFMLV